VSGEMTPLMIRRRRALISLGVGFIALSVFIALAMINLVSFAFQRVGLSPGWMVFALCAAIIGSRVDIPVVRLRPQVQASTNAGEQYPFWPTQLVDVPSGLTLVAVNLGGAVVPSVVAGYLLIHDGVFWPALLATIVVGLAVFAVARPVAALGVVVPVLWAPLVSASVAIAIGGSYVPALAYIAGTFGTLVGADFANLRSVRGPETMAMSIGGGGTFDSVFLSGIVAVLLTAL